MARALRNVNQDLSFRRESWVDRNTLGWRCWREGMGVVKQVADTRAGVRSGRGPATVGEISGFLFRTEMTGKMPARPAGERFAALSARVQGCGLVGAEACSGSHRVVKVA